MLARRPDGVFLSNGPGDPAAVGYAVEAIRGLLGEVPVFGICLGHQLMSLAIGGTTYKLPFGHHGGNHPVRHEATGRIEITSQNHNFCVDPASLDGTATVTHLNLNDGTVEGMRVIGPGAPAFSVQYHPEAGPGPHDAQYLFAMFDAMMDQTGSSGSTTTGSRIGTRIDVTPPASAPTSPAIGPRPARTRTRGGLTCRGATTSNRSSSSAPGRS